MNEHKEKECEDELTDEEIRLRLTRLLAAEELCETSKIFKRYEFSKVMLSLVTAVVLILTIFLMWMMIITRDLSPASYLLTGWFAEFATATAFYYWKAKAENVIKLTKGEKTIKNKDPFNQDDYYGDGFGQDGYGDH